MTSNRSNPHHIGNPQLIYKKTSAGPTIVQPQDLNIVWGGDDRYWNIPGNGDMAELYQVSWLEVTGFVNETNPDRNYEVGFEVSLAPNAFGWGASPLYLMTKRGKEGKSAWKKFQVNPDETQKFKISGTLARSDQSSTDDKKMARYQINTDQSSTDDKKLYFGLYEVWSEKWKGGLRIHHAYVTEV